MYLKAFINIPHLSPPSHVVISAVPNAYKVFKGQQLAGRSGMNSTSGTILDILLAEYKSENFMWVAWKFADTIAFKYA